MSIRYTTYKHNEYEYLFGVRAKSIKHCDFVLIMNSSYGSSLRSLSIFVISYVSSLLLFVIMK